MDSPLTVNGEEIPNTFTLKYLGVILDRKLDFSSHTQSLCARAKAAIGLLHRTVGKWFSRKSSLLNSILEKWRLYYCMHFLSETLCSKKIGCCLKRLTDSWLDLEQMIM